MSAEAQEDPPLSHYSPANRIDIICDRFEREWQENKRPQIEAYLPAVNTAEQSELFCQLLAIELDYRRREGTVDIGDYLGRFPEYAILTRQAFAPNSLTSADGMFDSLSIGSLCSLLSPLTSYSGVPSCLLESHLREAEFAPHEYLMRQGEPGTSLMVVREGQVEISVDDSAGNRHALDRAGPGQVLGEMSLLSDERRSANAVALEQVRAGVMPVEDFHQLARQYPELAMVLTELIAGRLGHRGRDALTDKQLDRYRIKRRLGRGGMGVVYEAVDTTSGEERALKMMSHRLVYCAGALDRFQQEADLIESFRHPNIVRMYGRFSAFHTFFIVMELCDGQTLQQLIAAGGALPEDRFRRILGQLASAIAYAHQAKVVHGDIKPANILLTSDASVKLTDFGLATPLAASGQAGRGVSGTPRYMAPEQRIGRSPGQESDYFAFGCVAYEMLTAMPLFTGSNQEELDRDFTDWQPPALSRIRPDLSDDVRRLLEPAFCPDPRQRQLELRSIAGWGE